MVLQYFDQLIHLDTIHFFGGTVVGRTTPKKIEKERNNIKKIANINSCVTKFQLIQIIFRIQIIVSFSSEDELTEVAHDDSGSNILKLCRTLEGRDAIFCDLVSSPTSLLLRLNSYNIR